LYDSHGIPPEIVNDVAAEEGAEVDLPDNFYSAIADLHSETEDAVKEDPFAEYRERIDALPPTKKLFYEQVADTEFDAMVIDQFNDYIVLDQTLFYPEGGGQPSDIGRIISDDVMVKVIHSIKVGDVILHKVKGDSVRRGVQVKGIVDESFRWTMMRHHTATHVLLRAAKEVLGNHVHQSGAQKGFDSSRIDLRHFRHITPSELKKFFRTFRSLLNGRAGQRQSRNMVLISIRAVFLRERRSGL
jgi:alanyl-tRNA synthetase